MNNKQTKTRSTKSKSKFVAEYCDSSHHINSCCAAGGYSASSGYEVSQFPKDHVSFPCSPAGVAAPSLIFRPTKGFRASFRRGNVPRKFFSISEEIVARINAADALIRHLPVSDQGETRSIREAFAKLAKALIG